MRLMSCNVRYSGAQDGDDAWPFRKDFLVRTILGRAPDIIGFQEVWEEQFDFLKAKLRGYSHYGVFNLPGAARKDPLNAIFYKKASFELLTASAVHLSETPHIPASLSWDNSEGCPRYANWVQLRERSSGKEFRFINTHLDHIGQKARENQARLICENAGAYPSDYPQLLTGDMNCDAGTPAIKTYLKNGWFHTHEKVHGTAMPGFSFHEFKGDAYGISDKSVPEYVDKMDWILAKGNISVKNAEIVKDATNGRYPSDHYLITAEIEL